VELAHRARHQHALKYDIQWSFSEHLVNI
jgi:hypothetical protein